MSGGRLADNDRPAQRGIPYKAHTWVRPYADDGDVAFALILD